MPTRRLRFDRLIAIALLFALCVVPLLVGTPAAAAVDEQTDEPKEPAVAEAQLLTQVRQLTFAGRRAGEGYFSRDGHQLTFQSEREDGNPFFQIYVMDFATGDVQRVSPGHGKTTCSWFHPDGRQVLFSSTHEDPLAKQKQREELELRAAGEQRRYSWDYDENYDIYRRKLGDPDYTNLTNSRGYDAEASWSPDGRQIAFASNRRAYVGSLSDAMRQRLEQDPAYFIDLYIMDADGGNVRQLTDVPGYDGGPFFSPDGKRLCWRRFGEDGATAEIMTMKTDGTDVRRITQLGHMSWAPFFHPSGQYLIFTTNVHGFDNFELYLVDVDGRRDPVRVTYTEGFDGLPAFSPDGRQLTWTSNRGAGRQSQIFLCTWNHQHALELLGIGAPEERASLALAASAARDAVRSTRPDCSPQDVLRHVDYLCRPELLGRRTGTPGEQLATAYVAAYLDQLGLGPQGDGGTWFQNFDFTAGVALGTGNELTHGDRKYEVDREWVPLAFSSIGDVEAAPVVFAGYGITAPGDEGQDEYDSFVHLDVKDKWILALRFMPEDISPARRQHLARHSSLRFKAMLARDLGAHGLILVSGPNAAARQELVRLRFDGSLSSSSLPIISVSDEVADSWLQTAGKALQDLQDQLDKGDPMMGFELPDVKLGGRIDIEQVTRQGRNVLGVLQASETPASELVIVGAHIDHLGEGLHSSSLAGDDERSSVHWGADDNASGVAAMLEIAQWLSLLKSQGKLEAQRDIVFAAWSGEEDGLIGSSHYVASFLQGSTTQTASPHAEPMTLYPRIAACLNLDMVGRLNTRLILQGIGSSSIWRGEIEQRNAVLGLPITLQNDGYIPTDASVFYTHGVPILSAFTGSHEDYHTPRDTPDKLNYDGAAKIAQLMALVTRSLAMREDAPDYVAATRSEQAQMRANLRAYLGTIPDYASSDVTGVKLSAVAKDGPAAEAGVRGGDVIISLAGRKIENIYDYTYAIEALKIGEEVEVTVRRGAESLKLQITPGSRE